MQIIKSFLDTDFYKLTMGRFVFHNFPFYPTVYEFKCRNKDVDLSPFADLILEQIHKFANLKITEIEKEYLKSIDFDESYIDFLSKLKLNPEKEVEIKTNPFSIRISGEWKDVIYYEVPILAIINEIYFNHITPFTTASLLDGDKRLQEKISLIQDLNDPNFKFMDFGTRRRRSSDWQLDVISTFKQIFPNNFIGTSNIHFAHLLKIKCLGTMAHEFLSAYQQIAPIKSFQYRALYDWIYFNKGNLGIALTDIIGFDAFLKEFSWDLVRLYDGMRQDSGDPIKWGEKFIQHYKSFNIDPKTKTAVFSNALTIKEAIQIYQHFKNDFKMIFGIGTHLTNDFNYDPLNIVIKMIYFNNKPVAKLADDAGKGMCPDENWVKYLIKVKELNHVS